MLNFLTFSLLFSLSTIFFAFSQNALHVKSVWSGVNSVLLQEAVVVPSLNEDALEGIAPCFEPTFLQSFLEDYLSRNLTSVLSRSQWNLACLYSSFQQDDSYPQGVKLTFKAVYYSGYSYTKSKDFLIKKGAMYGA